MIQDTQTSAAEARYRVFLKRKFKQLGVQFEREATTQQLEQLVFDKLSHKTILGNCKRCGNEPNYALMCGYCSDCFIEREDELKVILLDSLKHPAPGNSERLKAEIAEKVSMNKARNNFCLKHKYNYSCRVCDSNIHSSEILKQDGGTNNGKEKN